MFGWEIKSKLHGWPAKFRNINQLEGSFPSSRLFVHMMLCDEAFILYIVFFTVLVGEDFDFRDSWKRVTRCIQKKLHAILLQSGRMVVPAAT